VILKNP